MAENNVKQLVMFFSVLISLNSMAQTCKGGLPDNIKWRKLPVEVTIDRTIPFYYFNTIYDSIDSWNNAAGYQVLAVADKGATTVSRPKVWTGKPYELAVTTTNYQYFGSVITSVQLKYNVNQSLSGNLRRVTTHELGHVLGLAHVDDVNDLMYYYSNDVDDRWQISEANIATLRCLYEK